MGNIILYIKCLWWNKIFLLGVISVISGILTYQNRVFLCTGTYLLGLCSFGRITIRMYKRTLADLMAGKSSSIPYKNELYGERQGRKWACTVFARKNSYIDPSPGLDY